jgi:hypothetical protein
MNQILLTVLLVPSDSELQVFSESFSAFLFIATSAFSFDHLSNRIILPVPIHAARVRNAERWCHSEFFRWLSCSDWIFVLRRWLRHCLNSWAHDISKVTSTMRPSSVKVNMNCHPRWSSLAPLYSCSTLEHPCFPALVFTITHLTCLPPAIGW